MAIGDITVGTQGGKSASAPLRAIPCSFEGDAAYQTGGTADFEGTVQDILGEDVTLITVCQNDCEGYVVHYDRVADKLLVYEAGADAAALDEVANDADLSGTDFVVICICQ